MIGNDSALGSPAPEAAEPEGSPETRPAGGVSPEAFSQPARQAVLAELGIMALGKKSFQAVLDEAVVRIPRRPRRRHVHRPRALAGGRDAHLPGGRRVA